MINLYTTTSCTSCRKAKSWFEKNGIDYIERNISKDPLTVDEIKSILRMTEGTDDALPLQELYKLLRNHPTMIKRPIIQDEKKIQVGYQEEEIRAFIPRRLRAFTSRKSAVGE